MPWPSASVGTPWVQPPSRQVALRPETRPRDPGAWRRPRCRRSRPGRDGLGRERAREDRPAAERRRWSESAHWSRVARCRSARRGRTGERRGSARRRARRAARGSAASASATLSPGCGSTTLTPPTVVPVDVVAECGDLRAAPVGEANLTRIVRVGGAPRQAQRRQAQRGRRGARAGGSRSCSSARAAGSFTPICQEAARPEAAPTLAPWTRSRSRAGFRRRSACRSRSSPTAPRPRSSATASVALSYGSTLGYGPLREWLAERHGVEPARVLVTNGSLQAFHFVLDAFSGRGRVLVERPTYDRPRKILAAAGLELGEVAWTSTASTSTSWSASSTGRPPRSSTRSRPSRTRPARRSPSERRRRLAELARERELPRARGRPVRPRALRGRAAAVALRARGRRARRCTRRRSRRRSRPGCASATRSSRPGSPGSSRSSSPRPTSRRRCSRRRPCYEFLRRGLFEPNLERVCGLLRARRDAMLEALERELAGRARWSRPEGGYFLWLDLPEELDASELLARASEAGVTFVPGADFGGPAVVRAARLQLRLARRDRRGRAAPGRASGAGCGAGIAARAARRAASRARRSAGPARSARRARCRARSGRERACCSRARTRSRTRSAGRA